MKLSQEFTKRIDNTDDKAALYNELKSLCYIMCTNHDGEDERNEMVEKIKYITKRISRINNPPS